MTPWLDPSLVTGADTSRNYPVIPDGCDRSARVNPPAVRASA
jgi:hypothetical protein